jgi:hypothetical protein
MGRLVARGVMIDCEIATWAKIVVVFNAVVQMGIDGGVFKVYQKRFAEFDCERHWDEFRQG